MGLRGLSMVALCGACTFGTGVRTGTGVSRSSEPVAVVSPIGEPGTTIDSSYSQEWLQVDVLGEVSGVRGLFALGGGNSHARFRNKAPGMEPIFAVDDGFHARVAVGVGFVTPAYHGLRLQPYAMLNNNFGDFANSAGSTKELGVDLELVSPLGSKGTSTFMFGVARIWESGGAEPNFGGNFSYYEGDFETAGWMLTFGWHFAVRLKGDD